MIRSDNHIHSYYSTDSEASMTDIIEEARHMGFESICFTDHMDYNFPSVTEIPDFVFDMNKYTSEISLLDIENPDINIRKGVELGLKEDVVKKCLELTKNYSLDFVIGSTHLVDNIDPYDDEYWVDKTERKAITRYYETTLNNLSLGIDFDVYGHIDYIIRYTPKMKILRSKGLNDEEYSTECLMPYLDIIEEILKKIINLGKGIEVNTAGLKYGLCHPNPNEKILKLYHELGGEIITIGSDAHEPKHIGYEFDVIPDMLKACGFKYYTEFKNRKPVMITLD